jgi:hypothetical protein
MQIPRFWRKKAPSALLASPAILSFNDGEDIWTVNDAFEGTQIFGATGSGKTTGSGQRIALGLLDANFGGLVLTAKKDEKETWLKYAAAAGRQNDVIIFGPRVSPETPYTFNFLEYERNSVREEGISLTDNLVALFCAVVEVAQRSGGGGGRQDAYWLQALKHLLRNAIDLLIYSKNPLNFRNIHGVITTAPKSVQEADSEDFSETSFCGSCAEVIAKLPNDSPELEDALLTWNYWTREFPSLATETRSIIMSYFTSMGDCFLRGALKDLFSSTKEDQPQLKPELTHRGAIIILDLPVKQFNEVGQFAQVLYKYIWQRATERRNPKAEAERPVFLWADEAQYFVNSNDMLFQTTARASRAATVYLTQNISNYYALMPSDKARAETDSLLGNFQTKIFHANGDSVTNKWAAEMIGKTLTTRNQRSASISTHDRSASGGSQFSTNQTEQIDYQVPPVEFTTLAKGGVANELTVESVMFQGGRRWSSGGNFIRTEFVQSKPEPKEPKPRSFEP